MARTPDGPSHRRYSHFRCEEGTVTNVNRKTYTVTVQTRHSDKDPTDIQVLAPYHHYENGEGFHHLPEVGAICMLGWPSDNTPPFIMGYLGAAAVQNSADGDPERSTTDGSGSMTDVSFRSRRPQLNPGDIALTGRDENFIYLRRGGVVQIGATNIAQTVYIPVLNFMKHFSENFEHHTFAGDIAWTVERQESDPSGNAPATYVFHMNEFAQDQKASIRLQHLPLGGSGSDKSAWTVHVAPQGIDRDDGTVESEVYSMVISMGGKKTEIIGGDRSVTVKGSDSLTVQGSRTVRISGDESTTADGKIEHIAAGENIAGGSTVRLGSRAASNPAVKGQDLVQLLASAQWPVATVGPGMVASPSPAFIAALAQILSTKVLIE